MTITKAQAQRVLEVVDAGLVKGLGEPVPGKMCVEAAVCFALGLKHGDEPTCVGSAVQRFKIRLNDAAWSSNKARTKGLRKLAVAQLGSDTINQQQFAKTLAKLTINRFLPVLFRDLAEKPRIKKWRVSFLEAADRCEREGTRESAQAARKAAAAAAAYADAADAYAAAYAAAYAYADAADDAAAAAAAYAAAYAAYAADDAYDAAAAAAKKDKYLFMMADIGLEALKQCNSPGCQYLDLVNA